MPVSILISCTDLPCKARLRASRTRLSPSLSIPAQSTWVFIAPPMRRDLLFSGTDGSLTVKPVYEFDEGVGDEESCSWLWSDFVVLRTFMVAIPKCVDQSSLKVLPRLQMLAGPTCCDMHFDCLHTMQRPERLTSLAHSRRGWSARTLLCCANVDNSRTTIPVLEELVGCEDVDHIVDPL